MEEKKTYRLEEMLDSMKDSIDNIASVIAKQKRLLEIVGDSPDAEDFADFIEASEKQIEDYEEQKEKLLERKSKLDFVIKSAKENEATDTLVNNFMDAIGMFDN